MVRALFDYTDKKMMVVFSLDTKDPECYSNSDELNVTERGILETIMSEIALLSSVNNLLKKYVSNKKEQISIEKKMEVAEGKIEDLQNPKDISGYDDYIYFANTTTLNNDLVDEFIDCVYLYDEMRMEVKWKFSDEIEKNMRKLTENNMTIT